MKIYHFYYIIHIEQHIAGYLTLKQVCWFHRFD